MRVFQTLIAFSGCAVPQLALTRELLERGHQVRVVAHRAARERIEGIGAEFVEIRRWLPDFDPTQTNPVREWEKRTQLGAAKLMRDFANAVVPDATREYIELLEDWNADVFVFGWTFTAAAIAAEHANIPAVALVHWAYPFPARGAPPLFSGLKPMAGPVGAARDRLLNRATRRFFAAGLPLLNEVRAEHGLAPLGNWEDQLLGVRALFVTTAPELDFASKAQLPANVRYVGPAFERFQADWESPWPEENTDPLVLISFSTANTNQNQLAQRVLDAVAGLPIRALLTTGALDTGHLRIPDNTRTAAFVPHRAVLPHASLVVTHTGWQTVNAALAEGVPLVCIPDISERSGNAARVVYANAGVRVNRKSSPEKLRRVITKALQDQSIKQGARAMAEALARNNGATRIADELERLPTTPTAATPN